MIYLDKQNKTMRKAILILLLLVYAEAEAQELFGTPYDKELHFKAGFVIGATTYFMTYELTDDRFKATLFGVLSGAIAGAGKEMLDTIQGGNADYMDVVYTALGSITATIPLGATNSKIRSAEERIEIREHRATKKQERRLKRIKNRNYGREIKE